MDMEAPEGVEKVVIDTLVQLLRLGVYIHKLGRVRQRRFTINGVPCIGSGL